MTLTIREAAQALSVSPKTIRALVKAGELPAFRVRRLYRISPHHVEQFKSKHEVHPVDQAAPRSRMTRTLGSCRLPGADRYL